MGVSGLGWVDFNFFI